MILASIRYRVRYITVYSILMKNRMIKFLVQLLKPKSPTLGKERRFPHSFDDRARRHSLGNTGDPRFKGRFPHELHRRRHKSNWNGCLQHNRRIDELFIVKDPLFRHLFSLYRKLKKREITHV
jgi:hypothetical protein